MGPRMKKTLSVDARGGEKFEGYKVKKSRKNRPCLIR